MKSITIEIKTTTTKMLQNFTTNNNNSTATLLVKSNRPLFQFHGSNSMFHFAVLLFFITILFANLDQINSKFLDYNDKSEELAQTGLPECQDFGSICGYMQLNKVGLNKVPICSCKENNCLLWWNIFDNRIIKHGSDFYKFCGKKPELLPCQSDQVAYVSYGKTDLLTGKKISDIQEMKCLCNNDYILKTNKTMFEMNDSFYVYGTEQICQKAPRCSRKQICLSITETAEATIERRHCSCAPGKYCPRDFRLAYEEIKEDRGTLYNMKCI